MPARMCVWFALTNPELFESQLKLRHIITFTFIQQVSEKMTLLPVTMGNAAKTVVNLELCFDSVKLDLP